jgi:hypothetical protein
MKFNSDSLLGLENGCFANRPIMATPNKFVLHVLRMICVFDCPKLLGDTLSPISIPRGSPMGSII